MVDTLRSNRRRARRWHVMWPATVVHDDRQYPCTILDLSESGVKIELLRTHFEKAPTTLLSERFGSIGVSVAWVRGRLAGLRFTAAPGEVARLLKPHVPGFDRSGTAVQLDTVKRTPRATFGKKPTAAPAQPAPAAAPDKEKSELADAA